MKENNLKEKQAAILCFIAKLMQEQERNPQPEPEPMTAAERDAMNRRIIEKLDALGLVLHEPEQKAGDSQ